VISQSPAANTPVTAGQTVALTISSGPQPVKVPSVLGLLETKADDQLTAAGLVVDTKTVVDPANAGRVVAQNPRAGTSVQQGTTVTITVATSQ
jgi:serine/threonine-protein kinase